MDVSGSRVSYLGEGCFLAPAGEDSKKSGGLGCDRPRTGYDKRAAGLTDGSLAFRWPLVSFEVSPWATYFFPGVACVRGIEENRDRVVRDGVPYSRNGDEIYFKRQIVPEGFRQGSLCLG